MANPSPVGRRLLVLRRRRKLSLRQLSEKAGVPFTTIHALERGLHQATSIPHAMKLAAALDVELSDLVPDLRTG